MTTIFATPAASPAHDKTAEVLKALEQGVRDIFASGRYEEYLTMMSKFHRYSFGNIVLILMQRPDSTRIAGLTTWRSLGRSVNKGETAIRILAPGSFQKQIPVDLVDSSGRPVIDPKTGKPRQVLRGVGVNYYRVVGVFDIAQTNGPDLPQLATELKGDIGNGKAMLAALESVAGCPVAYQAIRGQSKGYYSPNEHCIVIKSGMSGLQTIKTLVHEIAHSRLHRGQDKAKELSREMREVQAESVAFVVAQHFGIDTSEYSFGYLAGWSSDAQIKELRQSLPVIQHEACAIIDALEQALQAGPASTSTKGVKTHGSRLDKRRSAKSGRT